jgi:Carboxypeptidase regulatory-like domain
MKKIFGYLLALSLAAILCAAQLSPSQNPSNLAKPASSARIAGVVIKDPGGEPVKKALIELIAENQAGGSNYTVVTGPDGAFEIEGIAPGRYRLFAERTGFLEGDKSHIRTEGRLLTLVAGQEVKDLQIHLQAAAIVSGRVTDEDGDPIQNAEVSLLRKTYASRHARWEQAGSERTNDIGEYRIAGLAAGSYYVSVNPPPDFKSLIADSSKVTARDNSTEKPVTTYQTVYYPGTADRSQAAPIQLHAGDEFPANFSLAPTPGLTIRGTVVNLPPHSSPSILLQSREFNLVLSGADVHPDGSFIIHDVAPGAYTIVATVENASASLTARQSLQIGANSVEGLRLSPQSGSWVRGRLRLENGRLESNAARFNPSQITLSLHSTDGDEDMLPAISMGDGFFPAALIAADGSFEWKNVPPGNYYLQLSDSATDAGWFLKSVLAGGRSVEGPGIAIDGGSVVLDVVASPNGATIDGVAAEKNGEPIGNAVIVAVPEARWRSRLDRFRKTTTDQNGKFALRGIPPGEYTLFAWDSVDGEAYYDPDFLKTFESQAAPLRLSESDHKTLQLEVITMPDGQP